MEIVTNIILFHTWNIPIVHAIKNISTKFFRLCVYNDSGNFMFYTCFCCSFYLSNKTCKHDDDNDDNKLCVDKILNFHPYN